MTQYKTVPVEPTEAMIEAGNRALSSWIAPAMHAGDAYAAMIKEIPTVVPAILNRYVIAERIFDCPEVRGEFDMETARRIADFILAAAPASPLPEGGWQDISTAPRTGEEFQAWWKGTWQPRARFDPEYGSFQLWGRTDFDTEGWEVFEIEGYWQPQPAAPTGDARNGEEK